MEEILCNYMRKYVRHTEFVKEQLFDFVNVDDEYVKNDLRTNFDVLFQLEETRDVYQTKTSSFSI